MADSSFPRFAPRARSTSLPSSNRQAPFTREAAGGSPVRTSLPSAGMRLEGGVCGQRCGHGPAARTESAQGTPAEPPPQPCRHCHSRSSSLTTPRPPPPYGPGRSLRELGEDVTGSGGENAHRGREPPAAAPARSGGSGHAKQVLPRAGPGPPLTCGHDFALLPLQRLRGAEEAPQQGALQSQHGPAFWARRPGPPRWRPRPPRPQSCPREPSAHVRAAAAGSRHDSGARHAGRARGPRPAGGVRGARAPPWPGRALRPPGSGAEPQATAWEGARVGSDTRTYPYRGCLGDSLWRITEGGRLEGNTLGQLVQPPSSYPPAQAGSYQNTWHRIAFRPF